MSDSWVVDSCDGLHDIEAAMNDVKPPDRHPVQAPAPVAASAQMTE